MRYQPSYCNPCGRASLVKAAALDSSPCPACGRARRVVPGSFYSVDDLPLFAEIEAIVFDTRLTPGEATLIADELERLIPEPDAPLRALEFLGHRMMRLEALRASMLHQPARLDIAVGMLASLVRAAH